MLMSLDNGLDYVAVHQWLLFRDILSIHRRQVLVSVQPALPHRLCVRRKVLEGLLWHNCGSIIKCHLICDLTLKAGHFWTQRVQVYIAVGLLHFDQIRERLFGCGDPRADGAGFARLLLV